MKTAFSSTHSKGSRDNVEKQDVQEDPGGSSSYTIRDDAGEGWKDTQQNITDDATDDATDDPMIKSSPPSE